MKAKRKRMEAPSKLAGRISDDAGRWVPVFHKPTEDKATALFGKPTPILNDRWKLYRDGLTASFLSTWLDCREQCRLSYCNGWSSKFSSMPLEFGTAFHHIFEHVFKDATKHPEPPTLETIKGMVSEYEKTWDAWTKIGGVDPKQAETRELCLGMVETVAFRHFQKWKGDFKRHWLFTEREFCVPFEVAPGIEIPIRGKIDGVVWDADGKSVWILDTKTMGEVVQEDIAALLPLDMQVNLYIWALRSILPGVPVKGAIYNTVRRPGLKLKAKEKLSSYLKRVDADIVKRTSHYFWRPDAPISKSETDAWERGTFRPIIEGVVNWVHGGPHWTNFNALKPKRWKSDLMGPILDGNFRGHYQREKVFPELEWGAK